MRRYLHDAHLIVTGLRVNDYINRYLKTGKSTIVGVGREVEGQRKDGSVVPPDVCIDSVQIEQVLLNLIRNSIEAIAEMPTDANRRLLIEIGSCEGNQVQIQVTLKNTGPGLAGDQVDHIFKPFHTTKPKGIGMGLSISRSIIEAHNGRLWVDTDAPDSAAFRSILCEPHR